MIPRLLLGWGCMIFAICFAISCQSDRRSDSGMQEEIVIRIESEPRTLNPILTSRSQDREIHEYIFVSLGDYDPVSLEMIPVLIKNLPSVMTVESGEYSGRDAYSMEIKEEARWENGNPISGEDVLFTLKMAAHPDVFTPGWKSLLADIRDVTIDPTDERRFMIYSEGEYFLNLEVILTAEIYPRYFYDAQNAMSSISLTELKSISSQELEQKYPEVSALGKTFSSVKFGKEMVMGAGPYKLRQWQSGQYIVLEKKENYWGNTYPENTILQGGFQRIVFQIVKDETVALTLLKNDQIDFLNFKRSPFMVFDELQNDQQASADLDFYTQATLRNNMILLNNHSPKLKEKSVRQALAMLTDVNRMLSQIEGGYGLRINSFIHPKKHLYNSELEMIDYDLDKAKKLLDESGWIDTDGDQIRDKMIDGVVVPLVLDFYITSSSTSASILAILQQSFRAAQVGINAAVLPFSKIITEHLVPGDFDMSVYVRASPTSKVDPYAVWHSSSIGLGGKNYQRYSNLIADQYIEQIRRLDITEEERAMYYKKLQRIISDDHPVIFLYSPFLRTAIDDDIEPLLSLKRPGYFANGFKMRE